MGLSPASRGGRIEISSKNLLEYKGEVNAGLGGTVLFDPKNLTLVETLPDSLSMVKLAHGSDVGGGQTLSLADTDYFGNAVSLDGDRLAVGADGDDTGGNNRGAVYLFNGLNNASFFRSIQPAGATFANLPSESSYMLISDLTSILNAGINVTLQANNDITLSNAITVNNGSGNGGNLILQAGRSLAFNANITTDNGSLTATAGHSDANATYKDAGTPAITLANSITINSGTGNITLDAGSGTINGGASLTGELVYLKGATIGVTTQPTVARSAKINASSSDGGVSGWILGSDSMTVTVENAPGTVKLNSRVIHPVSSSSNSSTTSVEETRFKHTLNTIQNIDRVVSVGANNINLNNIGSGVQNSGFEQFFTPRPREYKFESAGKLNAPETAANETGRQTIVEKKDLQ
ncbi:MAG: FG-GAP repeat protein [Nitrospirae bacterium]|nr:FG-GAP repeat protein [Nitrospirota bacterium]